jgi:ketopantoate reductase
MCRLIVSGRTLTKAPVELARLTGVPAPSLKIVHALIDLLTRP